MAPIQRAPSQKHTQTSGYVDEGLYQGPPDSGPTSRTSVTSEGPVSMKIPRPKVPSRHSDLFQSSNDNGNDETFHSDNYLQAATKNKRRTSRLSSADLNNHTVTQHQKDPLPGSNLYPRQKKSDSSSQAGMNLREMYTNRAFT